MAVAEQIAALKSQLRDGVSPAMATPLLAGTHTVNTAVVPQLVDFLIDKGGKGLFVGGGKWSIGQRYEVIGRPRCALFARRIVMLRQHGASPVF